MDDNIESLGSIAVQTEVAPDLPEVVPRTLKAAILHTGALGDSPPATAVVGIVEAASTREVSFVRHALPNASSVTHQDISLGVVTQTGLLVTTEAPHHISQNETTNSLELFSLLRSSKQRTVVNFGTSSYISETVCKNF